MARFHNVDYRHRHALFGPPSRCLELGLSVDDGDLALAIGGSLCHRRMHPGRHPAAGDGYRQGAMAALRREISLLSTRGALFSVAGDPHESGLYLLSRHAKWCLLGRSVDIVSTSTFLKYSHVIIAFCEIRALPDTVRRFPRRVLRNSFKCLSVGGKPLSFSGLYI